ATVRTSQQFQLPFYFEQRIPMDSITKAMSYKIKIRDQGIEIIDEGSQKVTSRSDFSTYSQPHDSPLDIDIEGQPTRSEVMGRTFIVSFNSVERVALGLKSRIGVEPVGKQSDLLKISIKGESRELSEKIVNTLMAVFDQDGINDRQLISKRTLDFID